MEKPTELWLHKDPGRRSTWITPTEPAANGIVFECESVEHIGLDSDQDYFPWLAPGTAVKLVVTDTCKRHPALDEHRDEKDESSATVEEIDAAIEALERLKERLERKGR